MQHHAILKSTCNQNPCYPRESMVWVGLWFLLQARTYSLVLGKFRKLPSSYRLLIGGRSLLKRKFQMLREAHCNFRLSSRLELLSWPSSTQLSAQALFEGGWRSLHSPRCFSLRRRSTGSCLRLRQRKPFPTLHASLLSRILWLGHLLKLMLLATTARAGNVEAAKTATLPVLSSSTARWTATRPESHLAKQRFTGPWRRCQKTEALRGASWSWRLRLAELTQRAEPCRFQTLGLSIFRASFKVEILQLWQ